VKAIIQRENKQSADDLWEKIVALYDLQSGNTEEIRKQLFSIMGKLGRNEQDQVQKLISDLPN